MTSAEKLFPRVHYPALCNPNHHQRDLFTGWGSTHAVDIVQNSEGSGIQVHPQMTCSSRHWKHFNAELPSLPSLPYNHYSSSQPEPCMYNRNQRKKQLIRICHRLKTAKGRLKPEEKKYLERSLRYLRHCRLKHAESLRTPGEDVAETEQSGTTEPEIDNLEDEINFYGISQNSHIKLDALLAESQGVFEDEPSSLEINSDFAGGCLSHVSDDTSGGQLFLSRGRTLNNLYTVPYTAENHSLNLNTQESYTHTMDSQILQIEATRVQNRVYVGVREQNKCHLLASQGSTDEGFTDITQQYNPLERPSHMSLSPYLPSDALVCTTLAGLSYVYMLHDGRCVLGPVSGRFHGTGDMWQCYYGASPREAVLVDHTGVAIWDIRGSSPAGVDVLTLPHKSLHPKERVLVSTRHPTQPSYHLVATDYSLLLLDARFPNHTVLMWSHALISAPQYLDVTPGVLTEDLVLLGSQLVPEVLCYPVNMHTASTMPPTCSSSPWRISKITDFAELTSREEPVLCQQMIDDRLDNPLVGVCGIRHGDGQEGCSILQLSSVGDLFSQDYRCHTTQQKYFSGPGSLGSTLPKHVHKKACDWLRDVTGGTETEEEPGYLNVERSQLFSSYKTKFEAHLLCELCSCRSIQQKEPLSLEQPGQVVRDENQLCYGCSNSIAFTKKLHENIRKDNVLLQRDDHVLELPAALQELDLNPALYDITTQISLKLWGGEDCDHLVQQRLKEESDELAERFTKWKEQKQRGTVESEDEDEDEDSEEELLYTESDRRVYTISEETRPVPGRTQGAVQLRPVPGRTEGAVQLRPVPGRTGGAAQLRSQTAADTLSSPDTGPAPSESLRSPALDSSVLLTETPPTGISTSQMSNPITTPSRKRRLSTSSMISNMSNASRSSDIGFVSTPQKLKGRPIPLSPRLAPVPGSSQPLSPRLAPVPRSSQSAGPLQNSSLKTPAQKKPRKPAVMGF